MRRVLIITLALALSGCATLRSPLAWLELHLRPRQKAEPVLAEAPPPAPLPTAPADGLWAILDPGCPKPMQANIHAWPKCASPFWISRGKALVVRSAQGRTKALLDASFAADYRIDPGDPVIAQVGTEKDGYLFLALTNLSRDDQGRVVAATGAAVACPKITGGGLSIKPNMTGCDTEPLDEVRKAAAVTLADNSTLSQVAWIAPGAP